MSSKKQKLIFKSTSLVIDLFLITPVLIFAAWIYLIPPFQTFGYHHLFSDDAIFAMLARKVLEVGPAGAFHLAWGPLLPWLNALLHQIFNLPLEEGPRIITGIFLTLRVIPIYILAKFLFGRLAALTSAILVTLYTFILIPQEATLAEGLYSLIIFTGFLASYLALKTEKIKWYLLSGGAWGLAYLARLEGWFFLTPLFLLTSLKLYPSFKNRLKTIKLLGAAIIAFLLIVSPYLTFIKQAYGSFTLNPRINIVTVAPGNLFSLHKDKGMTTTAAQIYFSGEKKYYNSSLWHPEPSLFWTITARNWPLSVGIPLAYFRYFTEHTATLLIGGALGLLLVLFLIFKNNFRLFITFVSFLALSFSLIDFTMVTLEFTAPAIFHPNGSLELFTGQFWKMFSTEGYLPALLRNILLAVVSIGWLTSSKKSIGKLINHVYSQRLIFYLPIALFLGFIPLFFNNFATKYAIATGAIFSLFTGFLAASLYTFIHQRRPFILYTHSKWVICAVIIFGFLLINRPQIYRALGIRDTQYIPQSLQEKYLKNPGLAILKDHGPGAKIAVFHEAPVFYAKGIPFYFAADSNISLEQTLKYFEENKVDYIVANKFQAFYTWKQLRPLLLSTTKLPHWQMIYSEPPPEVKPHITDTDTDVLFTVWKHLD